jgi:hypothetical protein
VACLFVAGWLAMDARILAFLFARTVGPVRWMDMVRMRGATYPLMAVSVDLANAALVASVRRATGAPLTRVAGAMVLHYLCDLAALTSVAFGASLAVESRLVAALRPALGALALLFSSALVAARFGRRWLRGRPVAGVSTDLSLRALLLLVGGRGVFYLSFACFAWLTLPSFGVDVRLLDAAARMPVLQSVAALPISPAGVGTAQAAAVLLFGDLGSHARVLAWGLVYGLSLLALRLPLGLALWLASRGRACLEPGELTS